MDVYIKAYHTVRQKSRKHFWGEKFADYKVNENFKSVGLTGGVSLFEWFYGK